MKHLISITAASVMLTSCQSYETRPLTYRESRAPAFIEAVCGDCHAVRVNGISPRPEAPGFEDIANSPGLTRETLVNYLSDAHNYPMQMDVDLDQTDIDLVADYILTLQSDDYVKPPS